MRSPSSLSLLLWKYPSELLELLKLVIEHSVL